MRNPDLSEMLKAIAGNVQAGSEYLEQAAIELEKLEKIYKYCEQNKDSDMGLFDVREILKDIS